MGDRFNADEGFIHFAFANEDTYIKKSLAVLNRQKNLYYELKKKYYHTVIFVDLKDSNYRIICADGEAEKLYNSSYRPVGMFAAIGAWMSGTSNSVDKNTSTVHIIPRDQKEVMLNTLDRMLSNSQNTAFVCSLDTMASFQGISQAQKILNKQITENCGNRNILLIVCDTLLSASFEKLVNPDGIFQSEAFPQIREICQNYTNARLYECMKKKMPGRVSYMNEMKWDEIYNVVAWSVMNLGNKLTERMNHLDDYTDFIWLMTHSAKFSAQTRKEFPVLNDIFVVNDTRLFSVLKQNLSVESAYEQMDAVIAKIREKDKEKPLVSLVQADDTSTEYQIYLYQSNPVIKRLNTLMIHNSQKKSDIKTANVIETLKCQLNQIRKELVKPYIVSDQKNHEELQNFITYCVDCVQTADGLRDYETMKIGMDALVYAICKCEQEKLKATNESMTPDGSLGVKGLQNNGQALCLKAYESALQCQASIGEQKRRVRNYLVSLRNLTEQTEELQKEIEEIERKYPGIENRAKNLEDHAISVEDYRSLKAEFVGLEENKKAISYNMKLINMNLQEQKRMVAALRSEINSIEDSSYTMTYWQYNASAESMYDMGEKIAKLRSANNDFYERLHRENKYHTYGNADYDQKFHAYDELPDSDLDIDLEMDSEMDVDSEIDMDSGIDISLGKDSFELDIELDMLDNEN